MTIDHINGAFEFGMAIAIARSCWQLWRSRECLGWSTWAVLWPTAWGCWNLYYYPALGQWWSFAGGIAVVAANMTWLALNLWFRRYPSRCHDTWLPPDGY